MSKFPEASGANDLAAQGGLKSEGGLVVAAISGVALLFSGYSLWETSLKAPDLQMFVPPVIYYAAPYSNNFEMINVPVTLVNEGAQTGTALHFDLEVTNPKTKETKRFYSAEFGVWSMERARQRAFTGFSPISLEGHSSRAESILFYTRGPDEKPDKVISEAGTYQFKLTLVEAQPKDGLSGLFGSRSPVSITFDRTLPFLDARAFQEGTIFMHSADWAASSKLPRMPRPDATPPGESTPNP
jgi:hypothetical protein